MADDKLSKILTACTHAEAAEIKVLHNAQIATLKAYQQEPTAIRKKDWDAAKSGYAECESRLWYRYFEQDQEQDDEFEYNPGEPLIVTTSQASAFFGVTAKCFGHDWVRAGMPKVSQGKFDLKHCFDWWWENIASERAAKMGGDDSINEAKRQYWWSMAEAGQIKVNQAREELIPKDEVHRQWGQRAAEYKNACYGLINSLPPLLEGRNQPEMRQTIDDHVWEMFKRVTRYGKFCKKQPQTARGKKKK